MKIPGPDHPITVTAAPRRVRVIFQGHTIVDSDNALVLKEAAYKPVYYFPREDVSMATAPSSSGCQQAQART